MVRFGTSAPVPWLDLDHWRRELGRAADLAARHDVVLAWALAAGGTTDDDGLLTLPAI